MLTRRTVLGGMGGGALLGSLGPTFALASAPTERRLVVVILRGALDGLAAVPPYTDPEYRRLRGALALPENDGILDLDGRFGLHPALAPLHALYRAGEMTALHAVATPYRSRSHFDGQDVLENGVTGARDLKDGWLNRALGLMGGERIGLAEIVEPAADAFDHIGGVAAALERHQRADDAILVGGRRAILHLDEGITFLERLDHGAVMLVVPRAGKLERAFLPRSREPGGGHGKLLVDAGENGVVLVELGENRLSRLRQIGSVRRGYAEQGAGDQERDQRAASDVHGSSVSALLALGGEDGPIPPVPGR